MGRRQPEPDYDTWKTTPPDDGPGRLDIEAAATAVVQLANVLSRARRSSPMVAQVLEPLIEQAQTHVTEAFEL